MKNFEKYKTAKERAKAFHDLYKGFKGVDPFKKIIMEFSDWLELEAKKERPLPCPFCRGFCCVEGDSMDGFWVECEECRYSSPNEETKDAAIAAHNCLAKAVLYAKDR